MEHSLFEKLIKLSDEIQTQEDLNEKKISEFFRAIEKFISESIGFKESVWIDVEISGQCDNLQNIIFGWDEVDSEWHVVVGQRDTYIPPDSGDEIVYGSFPREIKECHKGISSQVFEKSDLLIKEIYQVMKNKLEYLKDRENNIINMINKVYDLLHGSSNSEGNRNQVSVLPNILIPPTK